MTVAPVPALRLPRELPGEVRRAVAAAARGAGGRREVGAGQDAEGGAVTDDGDLGEPERYEPVLTAEERAGLRLEWLAGLLRMRPGDASAIAAGTWRKIMREIEG